MSYLTQKTIKKEVIFNGIALHSGVNVNVTIKPADPNFGIIFKRIDLKNNNLIYPNFANVSNTSLNRLDFFTELINSIFLFFCLSLTEICPLVLLKVIIQR